MNRNKLRKLFSEHSSLAKQTTKAREERDEEKTSRVLKECAFVSEMLQKYPLIQGEVRIEASGVVITLQSAGIYIERYHSTYRVHNNMSRPALKELVRVWDEASRLIERYLQEQNKNLGKGV